MRAIIYLRVSKDHQRRMGLRAQRKACLEIANKFAIKERYIFMDKGLPGSLPIEKRPGLLAATAMLKEGDVLIVANRARIARRPWRIIDEVEKVIEEAKSLLISAAGEGTDEEGVEGLKKRREADVNAEVFHFILKQKAKEHADQKRELGERNGTIPYGSKLAPNGKSLMVCLQEQEVVELVKMLSAQGHSYGKITLSVNEMGYRSRANKPFQKTQIVNILEKEMRRKNNTTHIDRSTPYGYKPTWLTTMLEKCPEEQEVIALIRQLREQGYSLREIVNELMVKGYRSRAGKPFQLTQVSRILKAQPERTRRNSHDPELIKAAKELRSQGHTLQAIVTEVNRRGYHGTTGKPLQLTQIARIVEKEA